MATLHRNTSFVQRERQEMYYTEQEYSVLTLWNQKLLLGKYKAGLCQTLMLSEPTIQIHT